MEEVHVHLIDWRKSGVISIVLACQGKAICVTGLTGTRQVSSMQVRQRCATLMSREMGKLCDAVILVRIDGDCGVVRWDLPC